MQLVANPPVIIFLPVTFVSVGPILCPEFTTYLGGEATAEHLDKVGWYSGGITEGRKEARLIG